MGCGTSKQLILTVLKLMRTHKLFAKASKCYFEEKAVEYLGHVINGEGVHTDPKKVQAVQAWPIPQNVKQLRSFFRSYRVL